MLHGNLNRKKRLFEGLRVAFREPVTSNNALHSGISQMRRLRRAHGLQCNDHRIAPKESVMAESMTIALLGLVVLVLAAILVVEHYRREHRRNRQLRWLDTHPMRDWVHRRP
jgi:hypothetical protein